MGFPYMQFLFDARLFKKTATLYMFMGLLGVIGMALHYWFMPKFPAYIYHIVEDEDITLKYLCGGNHSISYFRFKKCELDSRLMFCSQHSKCGW